MPEDHQPLPPQSRQAEQAVLGSMLRDNATIDDVALLLQPEHFYVDSHQKIYRAILAIHEKSSPVDAVILAEWFKDSIADIGGYAYLGELWQAAPTAANAEYYANIIRDKAICRLLIHAGNEIARAGYEEYGPADDLLADAEQKILSINQVGQFGEAWPLAEALDAAMHRIDARSKRSTPDGIMTGYADLDKKLCGFQPADLIIVAARPSLGKTSLALALAQHAILDQGISALFVSLEQSRFELAERLLCCQGKVDSYLMRAGHLSGEHYDDLTQANHRLRKGNLFFADKPGQGMLHVAATARRLKRRHNIGIIFVDYLQLIEADPGSDRRVNRQEQVSTISRRLKCLARELSVPVVAMAQLNREVEHRAGPPRLADLRDSGAVEQDADTVILLHRPDKASNLVEVIVEKQRNGPLGTVTLYFRKEHYSFEAAAREYDDPEFSR